MRNKIISSVVTLILIVAAYFVLNSDFFVNSEKINLNETKKLSNIEITVKGIKAFKDHIEAKEVFNGEEKVYTYDYDTDNLICLEVELDLKNLRDDIVFLNKQKIDKNNLVMYIAYDKNFKEVYFQESKELGMNTFSYNISRKDLETSHLKGYVYFIIPKEHYNSGKSLILAFETPDGRLELDLK